LGDLARSAVEWTHDLCRTLSPGIEDENSLPDLLNDLATKAENLFRTNCCCELAGQAWPIERAVSGHLYRIAQEAITNAARHGKAKHIVLRLEFTDSELVTSVTDDGSGIGAKSASAEGMGLQIMRYRATMIGGSIEIRKQSPGGTSVICRCPRKSLTRMEVSSAVR
jgi:signal transduction histidine kinase